MLNVFLYFFLRTSLFSSLTIFILIFAGCTPPVYQKTTYGIDDFMADSAEITKGKFAILELENHEEEEGCQNLDNAVEEILMDGDVLTIALYNPQRLDRVKAFQAINQTTGFRICDGKIHLPHIGLLETDGLTLKELKEKIQGAYCEEHLEGQIFINFKKRRERAVQIIGAKKNQVEVNGQIRLNEVLAKARIDQTPNWFKSYVLRDGKQLPIDLYKLIHDGDDTQNITLRDGDQIFLAHETDASIMVTGEVPEAIVIPVPYGFISLREALAKAGGISFTGNKGSIGVIRGDFIRPKVYCLNWEEIKHIPNQSLLLMAGDVVVVSEKPITQWNRFIDQVQPSLSNMQAGYDIYSLFKH